MISFFVTFLVIERFTNHDAEPTVRLQVASGVKPAVASSVINGFRVPENLYYHQGHTWALNESPTLVRVGMDEFAAKAIGKMDSISLPARNTWVRQGQKFATVTRDGKTVNLISPIEGSVSDINEEAVKNPESARLDSFNEGWLVTVQAPDQKTNLRNLMHGSLAKAWMTASAESFHPALAQDGGEAVNDFLTVSGSDWEAEIKKVLIN